MKNKKRIIFIIVIIILLFLLSFGIYKLVSKKVNTVSKNEDKLIINNDFILDDNNMPIYVSNSYINYKIKDDGDLFDFLDEISDLFNSDSAKEIFRLIDTNDTDDFVYYKLQQKKSSYDVYGYQIVVTVDSKNNFVSLTGNYTNIGDVGSCSNYSSDMKEILEARYQGQEFEVDDINKVIYEVEDGKFEVVFKYNIYDENGDFTEFSKCSDGEVIKRSKVGNYGDFTYTGSASDGNDYTIDVTLESNLLGEKHLKFYDSKRKISLYHDDTIGADLSGTLIRLVTKNITEPFSVYYKDDIEDYWGFNHIKSEDAIMNMANFEKVYDFYKNILNRDSYDNKGAKIDVYFDVPENTSLSLDHKRFENAYWQPALKIFVIGNVNDNGFSKTYGEALDVIAHEFTHAVISYTANFADGGIQGALNEGYADIMGSLIEGENFTMAEKVGFTLRDLENPISTENPKEVGGRYYFPDDTKRFSEGWKQRFEQWQQENGQTANWENYDDGGEHQNSSVIGHAAYLMYKNGAFKDKNEMAKVWYQSLLIQGSNSEWANAAISVMLAAKNYGLSDKSLKIIEDAFIETKMLNKEYHSLSGKVTDKDTKKGISGVEVKAVNKFNQAVYLTAITDEDGNYNFDEIADNNYTIVFGKAKYESIEKELKIEKDVASFDVNLNRITEEKYSDSDIVFVMDISLSMSENDPTDIRKQIISNIASSLDDNTKTALITFANKAFVIGNGISNNRNMLIFDIFNIQNDTGYTDISGTNGKAGIDSAIKMFDKNSKTRKYIVFLTDGQDNTKYEKSYDDLIKEANDLNIRILSIGVGNDLSEDDLIKVSSGTNGKYYHATKSSRLYKFNKTIFEELS